MGVVYKAEDTKLKRQVALKFLSPRSVGAENELHRFIHEAQAAAKLCHPNICTIYGIDDLEGFSYIAMECAEGVSLKEKIAEGTVELGDAVEITAQVAKGLAEAHDNGIVHRDIKSTNIMVTPKGQAKITDFGLAKLKGSTSLTGDGAVVGTTGYMSPEQARGEEVDHRTDIWSLGVVLYEMLVGRLPFSGDFDEAVLYSVLNEEPELPSAVRVGIPMELEGVLCKALAKSLDDRYASCYEMIQDLDPVRRNLDSGESSERIQVKERSPSIAVLPFEDLSADKDQEYFCDGISEEIINALTHIESLKVVARTSAFAFKGKHEDVRRIGRKLGVETVLEGSVRKSGDRLRVTVELVNVVDGYQVWSERFDRDMKDIFEIQDEISLGVADRLRVRLLGDVRTALSRRRTEDLEAYNLYLKGRYYWNRRTREGMVKAVHHFEQAIERDPDFALAYAGLADSYSMMEQILSLPSRESLPRAEAAAKKALEIDEKLAEAHTSLALVKWQQDWDWIGAESGFRRAIGLNPNYATAHHWLAICLAKRGRREEAIKEIGEAQRLDPLSLIITVAAAWISIGSGDLDRAEEQCEKALDMDPAFGPARLPLGWINEARQAYDEAIEDYLIGEEHFGLLTSGQVTRLKEVYRVSGWEAYWRAHIEFLMQKLEDGYVKAYDVAVDYARLGETDLAFEWLEKAYSEHDSALCELRVTPMLGTLRSDPRFLKLLAKLGLGD
jgi:serine/threonine protein kinase/tetratricopeptide (TPR) repeat protein